VTQTKNTDEMMWNRIAAKNNKNLMGKIIKNPVARQSVMYDFL
jgi:hypothetical protein